MDRLYFLTGNTLSGRVQKVQTLVYDLGETNITIEYGGDISWLEVD